MLLARFVSLSGLHLGFLSGFSRIAPGLVMASVTLCALNAQAQTPSLTAVAQAVYQQQAEQTLLQGYQQAATAQQTLNQGLFAEGASAVLKHQSDALTEQTGQSSWEAGVAFPLGLGAQNQARQQLSTLYGAQRDAYERLLQWQASGLVRQLIWDVKKAQVVAQHAAQQMQLITQLTEKVALAVAAGEQPLLDEVLARKTQAQVNAQRLQADSQLNQAWSRYQTWSGFTSLPSLALNMSSNPSADTSFEALPASLYPLNPLTSLNAVNHPILTDLTNHPQVQWHAVQVQKSQGESTLARAQAKPKSMLFLGAISEQDAQTNAHSQLIAEVSIPLGTPASYQADMAEQAYLLTEQTSRLAQVKQALQQSLAQHILQLQAHQAVQHSLEEVATQSLQAYQIAKAAYQQGETAIHSLLLAQQQMEQAALDLALSQADYGQKVSELLQTLGNNLVTPMVSMPNMPITPITEQSSFK